MKSLEFELEKIRERNFRVELDKKWETSWTRRIFLATITFLSAFTFLKIAKIDPAALGALVPTGGFLISTSVANPIRKIWENFTKK